MEPFHEVHRDLLHLVSKLPITSLHYIGSESGGSGWEFYNITSRSLQSLHAEIHRLVSKLFTIKRALMFMDLQSPRNRNTISVILPGSYPDYSFHHIIDICLFLIILLNEMVSSKFLPVKNQSSAHDLSFRTAL